jgi:hypothetical protein
MKLYKKGNAYFIAANEDDFKESHPDNDSFEEIKIVGITELANNCFYEGYHIYLRQKETEDLLIDL